jgi:putative restriction endonuclease
MSFGVFILRADSIYDDSPATQYQFPSQYLSRASQFVGDWIVYYEPTKVVGSRGYFGVAKVESIVPDPTTAGMFIALIEPDSYLDFTDPVPFVRADGITETGLLNHAGRVSGRAQAAVRPLSAEDFGRIVSLGLKGRDLPLPRDAQLDDQDSSRLEADEGQQSEFIYDDERIRVPQLSSRIVRDRVFRSVVLRAYDERCAVTGLKLINGGGRAEVEAAHIRPVEHNGPDIVTNGVALSGTAHWMFDRGLITFSDDLDIIISRHVNDRDGAESLLNKTGRLIAPSDIRARPHPAFLSWHRENCFKQ